MGWRVVLGGEDIKSWFLVRKVSLLFLFLFKESGIKFKLLGTTSSERKSTF
jgi:hypothetical protein